MRKVKRESVIEDRDEFAMEKGKRTRRRRRKGKRKREKGKTEDG